MNKAELIEILTEKLETDRGSATRAVENLVDAIVRAVQKGDSVTITGFGVFERRRLICMYICMYIYTFKEYVCMYVCMYVNLKSMYVYMYVYIYI
jgi:hypothetical protein